MKPIFIMLNGHPESGKDLFCEIAEEEYKIINYSTVDTIKHIAGILGWDGKKTPEYRAMLSDLKDLYVKYFDGSFIEITDLIKHFKDDESLDFMFIHAREPEEIQRVYEWSKKQDIQLMRVCIERESVIPEEGFSNHADAGVLNQEYDARIDNNGTKEEFQLTSLNFFDMIRRRI